MLTCQTCFAQGSDQSYLEKLHHELGRHSHFVKGADKRLWSVEFGIRHYAGPVTYVVRNFLEKNKDVQQDMFFDFLEKSSCEFAREVTKFRVCTTVLFARYMYYCVLYAIVQDLLSTYLETAQKKATKSKGLISGTRTGKGRPTVGDTFRTQLIALVDVLDSTTPW